MLSGESLAHNLKTVREWVSGHGGTLTVVTKALCGHETYLRALLECGVERIGDSRLSNIRAARRAGFRGEVWYIRPPHHSAIEQVVELADLSLNTELATLQLLGRAAERAGRTHRVILMVELGDQREGILPGNLVDFFSQAREIDGIEVAGIGASLGCVAGTLPSVDQLSELVMQRELLELKFRADSMLVSGASSAALPLLRRGQMPEGINNFRIGESILLGTDLISGGLMDGLRGDAFRLEAEVIELKEKSLEPFGERHERLAPFGVQEPEERHAPGERGWRALVTVGELDTDVHSLVPAGRASVVGASSDVAVVNVGDDPGGLKVGGTVEFGMGYSGLVRLMESSYVTKMIRPEG